MTTDGWTVNSLVEYCTALESFGGWETADLSGRHADAEDTNDRSKDKKRDYLTASARVTAWHSDL